MLHLLGGYILPFIAVIGPVILLHEFGHFISAKLVGIRVERFSIGFPPRMVGKKIGDTDYCLSWLPFGGYVKMAGMIDESLDNPEAMTGAPDEFISKNAAQKIFVITAGVLMNLIMAAGIYTAVTMFEGVPEAREPVADTISPGMPADHAGILPGDRITTVDGQRITTWNQLTDVIYASPNKPLDMVWEHQGATREATVTPVLKKWPIKGSVREVGLIGITPRYSYRPAGFFEAIGNGFMLTYNNTMLGVMSVGMLVTGKASVKDLGGPIQIAKMSGELARGGFVALLTWIAFISINIGLLNILPVPALDGGHLVLVLIEAVRRKPITVKIKVIVQQVGMVLLLALMGLALWNDVGRVGLLGKIKGMF